MAKMLLHRTMRPLSQERTAIAATVCRAYLIERHRGLAYSCRHSYRSPLVPVLASSCDATSRARQRRLYSVKSPPFDETTTLYDFDAMNDFMSSESGPTIIDVREPSEYITGYIPNALNIPVNSDPEALTLDASAFVDRYGFEKPSVDSQVVFYCKAGVRSGVAASIARKAGYKDVAEYKGSWLDWTRNGGRVER